MDGREILYPVAHSLVQAVLAARKTQKKIMRPPENGEKSHLCGEFEVIHAQKYDMGPSQRRTMTTTYKSFGKN
jgi:hypothetical protein